MQLAFTQRIVWIAPVAHLSFAAEIGIFQFSSVIKIEIVRLNGLLHPHIGRVDVIPEIVAEYISLIDFPVGTFEVVLLNVRIAGEVTVAIFIDIEHILRPQQVVYCFKLLRQ